MAGLHTEGTQKGIVLTFITLVLAFEDGHALGIDDETCTQESCIHGSALLQKQTQKISTALNLLDEPEVPLTEEGFTKIQSECCTLSFDHYSRRVIADMGLEICDEGCFNGFIPWFSCGKSATLQNYTEHIKTKSHEECSCFALIGHCPAGGLPLKCLQSNTGKYDANFHRRRACKAIPIDANPNPPKPKATCDIFLSCSGKTPVNKGSKVQCSGGASSCDVSTCCEAKATCESFSSCSGEAPVNKGSEVQCSGAVASCDVSTCCEAKATCNSFASCSGETPVNKGSEVQCSGDASSCDVSTCCDGRATCDSFPSCNGVTPVNKGKEVQCSGAAASCDVGTCCAAQATCDSFASCSGETPVNKGSEVQCSGDASSCDVHTCCEATATCDSFPSCSGDTPVNKGKEVQCSGAAASCNVGTCCAAKATCDSFAFCSGETPVNKGSEVQCSGDASSCDVSSCCEAQATCASFSLCNGLTPVNKGAEVLCSGSASSCDVSTCCEAKATCDSFASCSGDTPVNKGSEVQCSAAVASCDVSTCCEAKATCNSFGSCSGETPVNKGSEVQCSGDASSCDVSTCCDGRATCDSFPSCNGVAPVNKGKQVQCSGATTSCDVSTCCEAKATCVSFASCSGETPVNKGSSVECSGGVSSCDVNTCCEATATCDSFASCSGDTPVNKGAKVQCSGAASSCDVSGCCEAKATCDSFASCSGETPVNKGSEVQCSGATASCDVSTCCEAKATCDSFASCSGETPVNKGSAVECSGGLSSCDVNTCCEATATCDSFTSCSGDTPVNKGAEVQCSGAASSCDVSGCCEAKATCDSFASCSGETPVNKGSEVQCSGATASCDVSTCCEAKATCDSFLSCYGHTPVNKGSEVQCSGDASSCDLSTCCEARAAPAAPARAAPTAPATCDSFASCSGDTPVNKGSEVQCSGDAASCDANSCCEPQGTCDSFSCVGDAPVNKGRKVSCSGNDSSCNASTCCQSKLTAEQLKALDSELQMCATDLILHARDSCDEAMQSDPGILEDWLVPCLVEICNAGMSNAARIARKYSVAGDPLDVCSEDTQAYAASACHKELSENCLVSTEWLQSCVQDVCAAEIAGQSNPFERADGYCDAQLNLAAMKRSFASLLPPAANTTTLAPDEQTITLSTTITTTGESPAGPTHEQGYIMVDQPSYGCPENGIYKYGSVSCCCGNACCWDNCRWSTPPQTCLVGAAENAVWRRDPVFTNRYYAALKMYEWLPVPDKIECGTWTDYMNVCAVPATQEQCLAYYSSLPQADQDATKYGVLEIGAYRASNKPHGCLQIMTPGVGVAMHFNEDPSNQTDYDWMLDGVIRRLCCSNQVLKATTTTTTPWAARLGPENTGSIPPLRPYNAPASYHPITIDRPPNALFGVCFVWGDPHFVPFDNNRQVDFYGHGSFWIVKSEPVWVQGFYAPANRAAPGFTFVRAIAIGGPFLEGNTLMIDPTTVWWNDEQPLGKPVQESVSTKRSWTGLNGTVTVNEEKQVHVIYKTVSSCKLEVSLPHEVSLTMNIEYKVMKKDSLPRFTSTGIAMRQISGQDGHCGNFDGNAADDSTEQIKQRGFFGRPIGAAHLLIPY